MAIPAAAPDNVPIASATKSINSRSRPTNGWIISIAAPYARPAGIAHNNMRGFRTADGNAMAAKARTCMVLSLPGGPGKSGSGHKAPSPTPMASPRVSNVANRDLPIRSITIVSDIATIL